MIPAIDTIILDAIEQRIFPGAVVLVAQAGQLCHQHAYGSTMYTDVGTQPVCLHTCYDIASLTKVFTATSILQLLDAGMINLDTEAAFYLPGLHARGVSVRHLLTHTSGLNLQLSSLRNQEPAAIRAAIYTAEPVHPPGSHVAYTNINSLLLGDIIAHVYAAPLDKAMHELLLEPLDMQQTNFCPPMERWPQIAPTEWDRTWRGGLVQGSVHDESAHALGGVAGHAGLFSIATDLLRFAQMWLNQGQFQDRQILHPDTVAQATHNYIHSHIDMGCGLGWMIARPNFMGAAPAETYGHTGFTGPALAIVPTCQMVLILLSNRTYPQRTPPAHHAITAAVLDAALRSI